VHVPLASESSLLQGMADLDLCEVEAAKTTAGCDWKLLGMGLAVQLRDSFPDLLPPSFVEGIASSC
jgi:hypothetical protein